MEKSLQGIMLKTNYFSKLIFISLITLFFFLIINDSMAQKSIDTLNFATDRYVNTSLIYGHSLFIGGDFSHYGDSTVNGLCRLKRKDLSFTRFNHKISSNNKEAAIGMMSLGNNGLYVVGYHSNMFNLVAGAGRQNICLLDPETGHLKGWTLPPFNGKV